MKLNPDCIRDILLAIESQVPEGNHRIQDSMNIDAFLKNEYTRKYDEKEIIYVLLRLEEAGLINSSHKLYSGGSVVHFWVSSLTFSGHQYLEKIRDDGHWKQIKTIGSKIGDFSLSAIEKIAEGVTSAAISRFFNTP
ncbi:MAG TPA: hypothetical protein DG942_00650 [Ruminococcaceae bacterium]|jgi:DNA-binding PadR family transcriptional regulator|nr:hypothetical protein [Oscillospiraceae bacterium]